MAPRGSKTRTISGKYSQPGMRSGAHGRESVAKAHLLADLPKCHIEDIHRESSFWCPKRSCPRGDSTSEKLMGKALQGVVEKLPKGRYCVQNYCKTAPNCARVITHREMPCAASYLHCRRCQKSTRTKQNSFPLLGCLCHYLRIKLNIMPTQLQGKNMFQYRKHYNEGWIWNRGAIC